MDFFNPCPFFINLEDSVHGLGKDIQGFCGFGLLKSHLWYKDSIFQNVQKLKIREYISFFSIKSYFNPQMGIENLESHLSMDFYNLTWIVSMELVHKSMEIAVSQWKI